MEAGVNVVGWVRLGGRWRVRRSAQAGFHLSSAYKARSRFELGHVWDRPKVRKVRKVKERVNQPQAQSMA